MSIRAEVDHTWEAIHRHLIERQGLDLTRYKETYLKRRFLVRVRALRLPGLEAYARYLRRHPEELGPLQKALSIKVTSFFRNRSCFAFLEERVVPDLLRRSETRRHRIAVWSAGCATGEEPYSLAALFATALDRGAAFPAPAGRSRVQVRITGTDLDEAALEKARGAVFVARALLDSAPASAAGQFDIRPDGSAVPSARVRGMVRFERESLLDPIGREELDLIVCRNVLIYFSLEHQERILSRFAAALSGGGYLVLGRVERLFGASRPLFDVVSARDRVYRRLPADAALGATAGGGPGPEEARACA